MTKYIRFSLNRDLPPTTPDSSPEVRYGVLDNDTVREVPAWGAAPAGPSHPFAKVRLLPPCAPTKIVCVGRNYVDHAKELGHDVPTEPLIFLKPPSALIAHGDAIVYPKISERVDHEGELGVVIGRRARHVSAADAPGCIFGFTCVNDVTARDLQFKDGQWTRGKGFDTFCAVGPWIVPFAEFDLAGGGLRAVLDGQIKQQAPFRDMLFSVARVVEFATQVMTLEPGDLIATGTPAGVGPMLPGATIRVEIDGIGVLENRVMAA